MAKRKKSSPGTTGFIVGLVVGAFTGAAVAILLTPRCGHQTREYLAEKLGRN